MKLFHGFYSDVGNFRSVNQDSVLCRRFDKKKNSFIVIAVCDGIGGLEQGEVASRIICDHLNQTFDEIINWIDIDTADADIIFSHFKDAVEDANQALFNYRIQHGIRMGTTMSLLIVIRDLYYIIQVGDSRVYLLQNNFLRQLTVDASVSTMVDGKMKTYLDNLMGKDSEVWYSNAEGTIQPNDLLFVCCDGFYHKLSVEDVLFDKKYINSSDKINDKCVELTKLMMSRGEKDNISVGMVYAKA